MPKELLAQIAVDEEALELYEYGRQQVEHLKESQSLSAISNQMELDEHVAKMRQNPLLETFVDLREEHRYLCQTCSKSCITSRKQ